MLAIGVSALVVAVPVAAAAASASGTTGAASSNATTATTPVASAGTTTTTTNPNPDPAAAAAAGATSAPAAGTGTATVHVAFSTVSRTTVLPTTYGAPPPHDAPTGPTTTPTGAVKQGALFTLETSTGPNPANLHATAGSCTTNGTGACTISTAAGTYWVVETTTPAGGATSAPVQATATATRAPAGTVTFSLCGPTSAAQPCTPTATNTVGSGPVALAAGTGATATATSAAFTPTSAGTWCFAAVYTPASGSPYGSASDDVTGTAVASECVTVSTPATHSSGSNATVASATTIDTGMPWAGSAPFVAGGATLGAGMVLLGLGQRRRYRRVTKSRS